MSTFAENLTRFPDASPNGTGYKARCRAHDDRTPSLSIREGDHGRTLVHCHAGCATSEVLAAVGLTERDLFVTPSQIERRLVATYSYHDELGALLYEACRYEPKEFKQRRPDGNGGYIWNLRGVRRVLYHLPDVLAATGTVYICEGEKDVESLRALGLTATCNSGGAGKWRPEYSEALRDKHVVILPDADASGRAHGQQVAASLFGVAGTVKVVDMPVGKDVSAWLEQGGTAARLEMLVEAAPEWTPELTPTDPRPTLCVAPLNREVSQRAWELLPADAGLYRVGTVTVVLARTPSGTLVSRPLAVNEFRAYLDRHIGCYRPSKQGAEVGCYPPQDLAAMMLSDPASPLPVLNGITHAPTMRADGTVRTTRGYDPTDGIYLDLAIDVPPIPDTPTDLEISTACALIRELFEDFPFEAEADRTAAVALFLLPFVRGLIDGPTPLHLGEAPTPGSGKDLLVAVALHPGLGPGGVHSLAVPESEDELRKLITTILMEGRAAANFGNLGRNFRSAVLAKALTDREWADRRLGLNAAVSVLVTLVWTMTGNNPQLSDELVRRTVPIRLVPSVDRPEERTDFRNPDLLQWVGAHRAKLVHAALTLVRRWHVAGRPVPDVPRLGSFEDYRRVMGGILQVAGFSDFLKNRERLRAFADPDTSRWQAFVAAWYTTFGIRYVTVADLLPLAEDAELRLRGDSESARKRALGTQLGMRRQKVINGFRMEQGSGRARRSWNLVLAGDIRDNRDILPHASLLTNSTSGEGSGPEESLRNHVTHDTDVTDIEAGDALELPTTAQPILSGEDGPPW